jgi:antitoxin (DNA-binding transcriptional repressor) of toxin-antitoxin stability system
MKQIVLEEADLESCVSQAQQQRLVITRKGRPVALMVGVERMDPEQLELGSSDKFWKLITKRRSQKPVSRSKLEQTLKHRKRLR